MAKCHYSNTHIQYAHSFCGKRFSVELRTGADDFAGLRAAGKSFKDKRQNGN